MADNLVILVVVGCLFAVVPSVMSRKCYTCNSATGNLACADGYQTSQMAYGDCQYQNQNQFQNPNQFQQGGINPVGPGGQFQQPSQFGGGGDRCVKQTTIQPQGGPAIVQRFCGNPQVMTQLDSAGCAWNGVTQICVCDSNYCNGTPKLTVWTKPLAISTAILTLFASLICRAL